MYNALSVAHYIVNYCNGHSQGISNLKLQKILYFVQAEFLVSTSNHTPCFSDRIEAWDFGPVVPNVYHQYKIYGGAIIPTIPNDPFQQFYQTIADDDKKRINGIIQQTSNYTASQLVQITHNQSPWKSVYCQGLNNEITNDSILRYFQE